MAKRLVFMVMMAVWVIGCAGPKGAEKKAKTPAQAPIAKEEDELTKRVRALKENLAGKEKGLSRLSDSLQAKEAEKKQAAARLLLAQREIEDKEKEMALIRKFVENTKMANKETESIQTAIDDLLSATKKEQEGMQGKVDALKHDLESINNKIALADQQLKERIRATEREQKDSEAHMKRLEQEIAERQKTHLATKTKLEATLLATGKEKQDTDAKFKLWRSQIDDKEKTIIRLMQEFEQAKKIKDSEIETLNAKVDAVQKSADRMLQKTTAAQQ